MFMVLSEAGERRLIELAQDATRKPSTPVEGLAISIDPREELIRIGLVDDLFPVSDSGDTIARCFVVDSGSHFTPPCGSGPVVTMSPSDADTLTALYYNSPGLEPVECNIDVVRVQADLFSRLKGIFDTSVLNGTTVSVFGLGSGGSTVALELAKAGVGRLILSDFDRLKTHNVARHVCGLDDVGRFKTRATRDAILQHSPQAQVSCYETDLTGDADLLGEIVGTSDLVVVATDTEISRYLINEACLASGTVAVYGGAYERAFAGEVVRVIPGSAGCYACVRQRTSSMIRSFSPQQAFDYTEDEEFQAEPGLGLDVGFIALLQAKVALMSLLRGSDSGIGDIDSQMVIWTNAARPEDGKLFAEPMARYFVSVPRSPACPACGDLALGEPDASST
jgi:molybdopterin/thiamine biosynthesis adenylyltransferase